MTAEQINKTEKMNGARIFLECLRKEGVDEIFGYPGGAILHIYDELYKCDFIKHYLVRHEQAAVHAAEGYARITGKPGVVLLTSGPGACNAITGIANAYYDSYPLVVFTGQVDSVSENGKKITVLASVFGRETPVELDTASVQIIKE